MTKDLLYIINDLLLCCFRAPKAPCLLYCILKKEIWGYAEKDICIRPTDQRQGKEKSVPENPGTLMLSMVPETRIELVRVSP
ncbi:MAG TPA: hypothetical protein DCL58_07455, partial [Synergistaceae bacterium]|nr:hypothetical protein [Synergistaceae bacterium]